MTDPRSGPKIGVLVPFTNTNLEPDMATLCPEGCTMHFERLGGYDRDEVPDSDQMAGLGAADMGQTLRLICGIRPAAVLYGCTSATLTHGPEFDEKLSKQIKAISGAQSITAAGSIVFALQALGIARIGFASPYVGEINKQAEAFLNGYGFETVACADIGRQLSNYGQGELSPDQVYELALRADHPMAEAIVMSCTDMRSVEVIERVEQALGKPVVSSNQAMIFTLRKILDLRGKGFQPGRLFEHL